MSDLHWPIAVNTQSAYREYQRQRQLTLGDLLLENRIILLQGEIHDGNANDLVMKLLYLQSENRRKDIHFYINSPGGVITAGMAIYDTMQFVRCDVATYCVGQAASMGAVLLAAGAPKKRFLLPNSRVLVHQPHVMGVLEGPATDLDIEAREILRTRARLNEILAHHTGQEIAKIEKDSDRNLWLDAEESVSYGLADQILQRAPEIVRTDDKD